MSHLETKFVHILVNIARESLFMVLKSKDIHARSNIDTISICKNNPLIVH